MSKHRFMSFCIDIWSVAGLAHVKGHSFCIGGAVELLLAGVPPEIVATTGGWTSLTFLLYWCRMEEILPILPPKLTRSHKLPIWPTFSRISDRNKIPAQFLDASQD